MGVFELIVGDVVLVLEYNFCVLVLVLDCQILVLVLVLDTKVLVLAGEKYSSSLYT